MEVVLTYKGQSDEVSSNNMDNLRKWFLNNKVGLRKVLEYQGRTKEVVLE